MYIYISTKWTSILVQLHNEMLLSHQRERENKTLYLQVNEWNHKNFILYEELLIQKKEKVCIS